MATSDASSNKSGGKLVLGSPGPSRGSTSMALIAWRAQRCADEMLRGVRDEKPLTFLTFPRLASAKSALG